MIWFLIRSCAVDTTGRATMATNAIHSRMGQWLVTNASGVAADFIMSTRLPTKARRRSVSWTGLRPGAKGLGRPSAVEKRVDLDHGGGPGECCSVERRLLAYGRAARQSVARGCCHEPLRQDRASTARDHAMTAGN